MANINCVTRRVALSTQHRDSNPMPRARRDGADLSNLVTQRLLGTWRLVAFTQNGQPHPVYGRAPSGTLRYEPDGHMAVQIMPENTHHPGLSDRATADKRAIPGYIAYFGGYSVDEQAGTVAHDRLGNVMAGESRTVVRYYEFLPDDRLVLTLDEDPTAQVVWQHVR